MKRIEEYKSLKPAGHYSLATIHNNTVYVSGQLPIDVTTGEKLLGTIKEQSQVVLHNINEVLNEAGSSITKVLKVTVYISDIGLWDEVNEVYANFFKENKPARVIVPTRELHYGFNIEMDVIAYI